MDRATLTLLTAAFSDSKSTTVMPSGIKGVH